MNLDAKHQAPAAAKNTTHLRGEAAHWFVGDSLGLEFPAEGKALRAAGEAFLTEAFRAAGALAADNHVARITRFEDCPGGSTGRKLMLSVDYARPQPGLPTDLFVKFSRDFDDPIRDRGKDQMEAEVLFALISRQPGFPIAVPACLYADYHHASGSGIMITERVAFGEGAIERHYEKCLDHLLPEPVGHYRALVRTLGRLAGAHRAGRLSEAVAGAFPFDAAAAKAADPIRYDERQLRNRMARFADFFAAYPQLVPADIRAPEFLQKAADEIPLVLANEAAIRSFLYGDPDLIALCHWNANIDNAWFWRDASGALQCGLMDWGRVGQMNVALALWGGLAAAEIGVWDAHLDELLALFAAEYAGAGGPVVAPETIKLHLGLFVVLLGLGWLMDAPPLILREIPDLAEATGPHDVRFEASETARTQLHMASLFLHLWRTHDFGAAVRKVTGAA